MFEMPDIPMKPELELKRLREEVAFLQKEITQQKRASSSKPARKRKSTRTTTSVKQTAMTVKRPVRKLPPLGAKQTEQPRDRLGRFARKTGAVLLAGAKATSRAVAGTVKGVRKAHKTVKKIKRAAKRNGTKEGLVKRKRVVRRSRRR
jgi:hypothetical protein